MSILSPDFGFYGWRRLNGAGFGAIDDDGFACFHQIIAELP
jgi:hypothetical protein